MLILIGAREFNTCGIGCDYLTKHFMPLLKHANDGKKKIYNSELTIIEIQNQV